MTVSAMWMLEFAAFVVLLSGAALGLDEDDPVNSTCHTWTIYHPQTNTCACLNSIDGIVFCHEVAGKFDVLRWKG